MHKIQQKKMQNIQGYNVRTDLLYDPSEGFWMEVHDATARIGYSPLVQETSGSFVALTLKKPGTHVAKGESFGSVEAEKHVGHLKAPVSGTIVAVNEKVMGTPRLLNDDPYGKGWLVEIEMSAPAVELPALLSGEEAVAAWFESEIKKYKDKGWLAQP